MREPKHRRIQNRRVDPGDYKLRKASESDFDELITEPSLIYDEETGELLIVYLLLDDDFSDVVEVLKRTQYQKNARFGGMPTNSRIFGHQPRSLPRRDNCTSAALAREDPKGHAIVAGYAAKVSRYYQQYNPDLYAAHHGKTEKILGEWMIPDSVFTSGIINFNNPLLYHYDGGNISHVWSNMLVFKDGVTGGYLSCPDYGIGFELPNNSLIMFDGQGLIHGVTPIGLADEEASYRFSVVFYSLKQMWNCLPINEEIARAAKRRTEREMRRAGLLPPLEPDRQFKAKKA